jgi:hypothetical protein
LTEPPLIVVGVPVSAGAIPLNVGLTLILLVVFFVGLDNNELKLGLELQMMKVGVVGLDFARGTFVAELVLLILLAGWLEPRKLSLTVEQELDPNMTIGDEVNSTLLTVSPSDGIRAVDTKDEIGGILLRDPGGVCTTGLSLTLSDPIIVEVITESGIELVTPIIPDAVMEVATKLLCTESSEGRELSGGFNNELAATILVIVAVKGFFPVGSVYPPPMRELLSAEAGPSGLWIVKPAPARALLSNIAELPVLSDTKFPPGIPVLICEPSMDPFSTAIVKEPASFFAGPWTSPTSMQKPSRFSKAP